MLYVTAKRKAESKVVIRPRSSHNPTPTRRPPSAFRNFKWGGEVFYEFSTFMYFFAQK